MSLVQVVYYHQLMTPLCRAHQYENVNKQMRTSLVQSYWCEHFIDLWVTDHQQEHRYKICGKLLSRPQTLSKTDQNKLEVISQRN